MAEIICFPQERNVGKARHVALMCLKKRTVRDRDSYWNMVCSRMEASLCRAGFDDAEVDRQIAAFTWAVENEMGSITRRHNDDGPGAA